MRGLLLLTVVSCVSCQRAAVVVSADDRAAAREIWTSRCTPCHGATGGGDGPGALILEVSPRVLSDSAWQANVSDERIAAVIVGGGPAVGLQRAMPANADLEDKPRVLQALVEHVRGLGR